MLRSSCQAKCSGLTADRLEREWVSRSETFRLETSLGCASVRTGVDGRFTPRADPTRTPFPDALARADKENDGWLNFDLNAMSARGAFGYWAFPRFVQNGKWWGNQKENPIREPVTVTVAKGTAPKCD